MKKILIFILLIANHVFGQVNKPLHDPPVIINEYTEVLSFDICKNEIIVADASLYNAGDTVLMIQMKGALIDTSNTASFGTILDYKNAGNYEMNYISAKSGNQITLLNTLTRQYDIPNGMVQLVRVPYYDTTNFLGQYTCMLWDGSKGGVLVLNAKTINLLDDIVITGTGFKHGEFDPGLTSSTCFANNYVYPATDKKAAFKGEGIASVLPGINKGKGSPANGGGSGLSNNSGGGGGGNAGAGGFGGYQSDTCGSSPFDNRGIGGKSLAYTTSANKIFMGGGGGAGHAENASIAPPIYGRGGGIAIIIADTLRSHNLKIISNGGDGIICNVADCNDGMYGGGGGGTVLLYVNQIQDDVNVEVKGGNGAHVFGSISPGGRVGPGGGGGGGVFYFNRSALPVNISVNTSGNSGGRVIGDANNPWGATAGSDGLTLFDLPNPFDIVLFKPNIDSVRIRDSVQYCNNVDFRGAAFTNSYPVTSWQWDFGDGGTAITQNTFHNYSSVGTYTVKLIATDINGCKDSIIRSVTTAGSMLVDAGPDSSFCASGPVTVQLNGSGTGTYSWSPAAYLDNPTIPNPFATISTTTKFYLTMSNGSGCTAIDSVMITINPNPLVKALKDTSICKNATLILTTTGATNYNWSPGIYVSDSTMASPQFTDSVTRTLTVTGTNASGCSAKDTITVTVKKPQNLITPPDRAFCFGKGVQLDGRNGSSFQYLWTPGTYLNNPNIMNPIADPPFSTAYTVKITDNTCNYDSSFVVKVTVLPLPLLNATRSNDISCNVPFAHLNASGALQYNWTPSTFLDNNSIANPIANPTITTKYIVTGTNSQGCNNKDSIILVVNFGSNGFELPNSFTPNRDGVNDCFGIRYHRDVQNLIFIIYNRYGVKVFETKNAAICWDGYYKGQPADPGNYIYYLSATTLCGNVVKRGSILLIR